MMHLAFLSVLSHGRSATRESIPVYLVLDLFRSVTGEDGRCGVASTHLATFSLQSKPPLHQVPQHKA